MSEATTTITPAAIINTFSEKFKQDPGRFHILPGVHGIWNPSKMVSLFAMVRDDSRKWTQQQMADILSVDRSSVSRKLSSVNWDEFAAEFVKLCGMSNDEYVRQAATLLREETVAKQLEKARRKEIEQVAAIDQVIASLRGRIEALPPVRLPRDDKFYGGMHKSQRAPEHAVLLLSDLHVGQNFTGQEMGGINQYDVDIFKKRAQNLKKGLKELLSIEAMSRNIPELHVFALGDIVQGTNLAGEWGPAYTKEDVYDQVMIACDVVSDLLSDWSGFFSKVHFKGVVGNHGRGGAYKGSDKITTNWDNLIYEIIKGRMSEHKNVDVDYQKSWWRSVDVNGTKFLLVHGDYMNGKPAALLNSERDLQAMCTGTPGENFQVLCLGHFHSSLQMETPRGKIYVNGSFVGADVHSCQHMRTKSRPTQTLIGVEKGNTTFNWTIDLDRERK